MDDISDGRDQAKSYVGRRNVKLLRNSPIEHDQNKTSSWTNLFRHVTGSKAARQQVAPRPASTEHDIVLTSIVFTSLVSDDHTT
jgi:hypothetical protein